MKGSIYLSTEREFISKTDTSSLVKCIVITIPFLKHSCKVLCIRTITSILIQTFLTEVALVGH